MRAYQGSGYAVEQGPAGPGGGCGGRGGAEGSGEKARRRGGGEEGVAGGFDGGHAAAGRRLDLAAAWGWQRAESRASGVG